MKGTKEKRENLPDTAIGLGGVLKIAWPAVFESFFISLAGMIDTLMVSSIGSEAVAAVGLTTQPKFLGLAVFIAMNVAVAAIVARRKGERNQKKANETLMNALFLTVIAGIVLSIAFAGLADTIMRLCGSADETHDMAVEYFQIIMGCMIVFSIPASWVFKKIGWYKTVSIAGIVLMVFTLLRGFIGGSSYTALVITTTGIAVTQPFIINAFGMISALWFPPAERGIANGWGMISTYLGVVMAQFGVPWLMSTFGLDIPGALKVFGFLSIPMILWFILFAREKPPTPPADEDLIERVSFADGMKQLAKNKKFIYALLVFWLLQGVYFTLTTLMEPILQFFNGGSMDSLFIGTLGTILTVTGVITTLVLPITSDRSKSKKRKPIVLVCEIGTLVGLVLIITGHTVGLQILMACCLGIFLTGVTPIVMVLGYESAYPVSEGTTESLMQLGANGWGLICLLAVNGIFQGNHMGTLVFFLAGTVLSLVLTMMIKEASLKERRIE